MLQHISEGFTFKERPIFVDLDNDLITELIISINQMLVVLSEAGVKHQILYDIGNYILTKKQVSQKQYQIICDRENQCLNIALSKRLEQSN